MHLFVIAAMLTAFLSRRQSRALHVSTWRGSSRFQSFWLSRRTYCAPSMQQLPPLRKTDDSAAAFDSVGSALLNGNTAAEVVADPILGNSESIKNLNQKQEQKQRRSPRSLSRGSTSAFSGVAQPKHCMIGLQRASFSIGDTSILQDASFTVATGEKLGLVGANGSGKSTILRMLAGEVELTEGEVVKSFPALKVAFLRQEFIEHLHPDMGLKDELLGTFAAENACLQQISEVEQMLAALQTGSPDNDNERIWSEGTTAGARHVNMSSAVQSVDVLLERLDELLSHARSTGALSLGPRVDRIMQTMGFSAEDADLPVRTFSGGWKMRIALAKLLLQQPNIILLDEPTNHMDLPSIMWLEQFLQQQQMPMVVVSHDREFLNQVCTKIVDIELHKTVSYVGNYSHFVAVKAERIRAWRLAFERQERHVKEETKAIKRMKSNPLMYSQQIKDKEAALQRLQASADWVQKPPKVQRFQFRFPEPPRCGERVVDVVGLSHGFGEGVHSKLLQAVNFHLMRGDRVGCIGANGSGKSTMLKIIMGLETPQEGYASFGSKNVAVQYYEQNQADSLDLNKTVFDTLRDSADESQETLSGPNEAFYSDLDLRGLLASFLFKGDDVDKLVGVLSGGEKARLALCCMMLKPANLLLLDEPTNHLDTAAKEVLEEALLHYAGSVVIISHDRYFLSQVVKRIYQFENNTVVDHNCDYYTYMIRSSSGASSDSSEDSSNSGSSSGSNAVPGAGPTLKDIVVGRYIEDDDKGRLTVAKPLKVAINTAEASRKKHFGGSGVTCGNLNKGVKNAKRFGH